MLRSVVIGFGIQGTKRAKVLADKCVGIVDVLSEKTKYKAIDQIDLDKYDAAYVCTPDACKIEIIRYLLSNKKHVLVEKPLLSDNNQNLKILHDLVQENNVTLYSAYNHRFEPNINKMKKLIDSKVLGKVYYCKLFYGNGTALDVKKSSWRINTSGVLTDLGSHLFDMFLYWFNDLPKDFKIISQRSFEAKTIDYASIYSEKMFPLFIEMSYVCWKNNFTCDIFFEKGSAHLESLCKWGPSSFTVRKRKYPSGKPDEEMSTFVMSDPTWINEFLHFNKLCKTSKSNIENDIKINESLQKLLKQIPGK